MKAVILAGGEGKRLKCITGDTPKPLVPLLGRSVMEHIILLLRREGFYHICAAVKYRAEDLISAFGDGSALGVRICWRVEDEPLGTAGAVRNCADFYGDEDFLVISGDAVCDMELSSLMRRLRERRAAAAVALRRDSSPLRFGVAVTDAEGDIRAFVEKPDWGAVVSDLVNTGIYALTPRAMSYVPEGRPFDFARDLFPELLRRGERVSGMLSEGYWADIGTPLGYYRCCADALEGKVRLDIAPEYLPGPEPPRAPSRSAAGRGKPAAAVRDFPCADRAAAMGALSSLMLEMDADYSDGISLSLPRGSVSIRPRADRSALRVSVSSPDAEFASSLAVSLGDLIRALDQAD